MSALLQRELPARLVVCVTGSTGAIYGYRLLLAASQLKSLETHLVVTKTGAMVLKQEVGLGKESLVRLATYSYDEHDFMAPIASGSFRVNGTVIAPCSMKTLAGIATAYEENLVTRAASVALKEKWPLIVLTRETPLSVIHLRNMLTVAEAGGTIMPPLPPLYFGETNFQVLVDLTIGRVLDMLGITTSLHREWGGRKAPPDR